MEGDNPNVTRRSLKGFYSTAAKHAVKAATGEYNRRAIRKAVKTATHKQVDRLARRTGVNLRRKQKRLTQQQRRDHKKGLNKIDAEIQEKKGRLNGFGFWIIAGLALLDDFLDIIADLTIIGSVVVSLTSILTSFIILSFFYLKGVRMTTRKLVAWTITFIIELIPFAQFFASNIVYVFLIRFYENKDIVKYAQLKKSALAQKVLKKKS